MIRYWLKHIPRPSTELNPRASGKLTATSNNVAPIASKQLDHLIVDDIVFNLTNISSSAKQVLSISNCCAIRSNHSNLVTAVAYHKLIFRFMYETEWYFDHYNLNITIDYFNICTPNETYIAFSFFFVYRFSFSWRSPSSIHSTNCQPTNSKIKKVSH